MPRFEDRLWNELVEQHGALLADAPALSTPPSTARLRRDRPLLGRRVPALAAAGLALAVALVAIVIAIGSHGGTAAYAVVNNPNGTVTVTIRELVGIGGADARLRELGLPVHVVPAGPECPTRPGQFPRAHLSVEESQGIASASGPHGSLVIAPSAIPQGVTVVIGARELPSSTPRLRVVGLGVAFYEGTASPRCLKMG